VRILLSLSKKSLPSFLIGYLVWSDSFCIFYFILLEQQQQQQQQQQQTLVTLGCED